MENDRKAGNISKIKIWVALTILFIIVVYSIMYNISSKNALKNSSLIKATITEFGPSKGNTVMYVKYLFNGRQIQNHISVHVDTFKVGETILLKVSNEHPDEYIELVR